MVCGLQTYTASLVLPAGGRAGTRVDRVATLVRRVVGSVVAARRRRRRGGVVVVGRPAGQLRRDAGVVKERRVDVLVRATRGRRVALVDRRELVTAAAVATATAAPAASVVASRR